MDLNTLRAVAHSYIDQAIIEAVTTDEDGDLAVHSGRRRSTNSGNRTPRPTWCNSRPSPSSPTW